VSAEQRTPSRAFHAPAQPSSWQGCPAPARSPPWEGRGGLRRHCCQSGQSTLGLISCLTRPDSASSSPAATAAQSRQAAGREAGEERDAPAAKPRVCCVTRGTRVRRCTNCELRNTPDMVRALRVFARTDERTTRRRDESSRLVALSSPRSTAVRVLLLVCSPSELQVHLLTRHHALVSAAVMERKSLPAVVIKKSPFQARWFRALDCLSTLRRSRSRRFTRRLRRRRRRRARPRYGASLAPDTRGLATEAG